MSQTEIVELTPRQAARAAKAAKAAAKENRKFAKLGRKAKRVSIAKDVLRWLRTKRLKPVLGSYLLGRGGKEYQPDAACQACALGAIFACTVSKAAMIKLEDARCSTDDFLDGYSPTDMRETLSPFFSIQQLQDIEHAFEGKEVDYQLKPDPDALAFNRGVRGAHKRMKRIMNNIIRNEGTFKP